MKVDRLHRILQLVTILQSGTDMTASELADELNVSRRTIFRDLKILEDAGIPFYGQPGGGYRISSCFFMPPVTLEVSEAIGLTLLAKNASNQQHQPFAKPAVKAMRKLLSMMTEPVREVCSEMTQQVSLQPAAPVVAARHIDHFTAMLRAVNEKLVVELTHQVGNDAPPATIMLRPYHLRLDDRCWYVIGHSETGRAIVTLPLNSVRELKLTKRTFRMDKDKPFDVQTHLGKAWRLKPEGRIYHVEIEFSADAGSEAAEVFWHPTQKHRLREDGCCHMSFQVDGLQEICQWICGFGPRVKVLKPQALRDMVQRTAKAMLETYEEKEAPASRSRRGRITVDPTITP